MRPRAGGGIASQARPGSADRSGARRGSRSILVASSDRARVAGRAPKPRRVAPRDREADRVPGLRHAPSTPSGSGGMTAPARPIALTIGVFDGLHRGHQAIVGATVEAARDTGGVSIVATFDPHPDTIVRGTPPRPWITPPGERAELLHAMGVDRVEIVRFSRE